MGLPFREGALPVWDGMVTHHQPSRKDTRSGTASFLWRWVPRRVPDQAGTPWYTLCTPGLVPAPVARGTHDLPPMVPVPRAVPRLVPNRAGTCPNGQWGLPSKAEIARLGTRTPSEHVGPRNDGARLLRRGRDHTGGGVGTFCSHGRSLNNVSKIH